MRCKPGICLNQNEHSVRCLAYEILTRVLSEGTHADQAFEQVLKKSHLPAKDVGLLTELVNGTLRWRGQLDWVIKSYYRGKWSGLPPALLRILELGLYQLMHLSKVPAYAAVSESVEIARREGGEQWSKLVNGILRSYLRTGAKLQFPGIAEQPVEAVAVNYSHPSWLVRRWIQKWGVEKTVRYCQYNNTRPTLTLRVNTLKSDAVSLAAQLRDAGFQVTRSPYFADFLKIAKGANLTKTDAFRKGLFAIQDESTALAVRVLQPEPGDVVWDMCAAPGGKTAHVAAAMQNSGIICATDVKLERLKLLQENRARLQLGCVHVILADARHMELRKVTKILLDAPCSGLGVLARRADLRWRKKEKDIRNISRIQTALLNRAASCLQKHGVLVYSTCTLESEETEEQVTKFLQQHSDFVLQPAQDPDLMPFSQPGGFYCALPFQHRIDGAFVARLVRTE